MKAKIIKADGTSKEVDPKNGRDFSLEELKEVVKGWIEVIWFHDGTNRIMIINEEGKLPHVNLPYNSEATLLAIEGRAIPPTEYVVGDVLVCHRNQVE